MCCYSLCWSQICFWIYLSWLSLLRMKTHVNISLATGNTPLCDGAEYRYLDITSIRIAPEGRATAWDPSEKRKECHVIEKRRHPSQCLCQLKSYMQWRTNLSPFTKDFRVCGTFIETHQFLGVCYSAAYLTHQSAPPPPNTKKTQPLRPWKHVHRTQHTCLHWIGDHYFNLT